MKVIKYIIMTLFIIAILFPLALLLVSSLKDASEIFRSGMNFKISSDTATLDNYKATLPANSDYFRWYGNSLFIILIQVPLVLLFSFSTAYAVRFFNFKAKKVAMLAVLIMLMIPFEIIMLPLFNTVAHIGLLDSYGGMILPFIVSPFVTLFMIQYLRGIPDDYIESGRVDGANELVIFWIIIRPLLRPAFGAMAIFSALNVWNNYLWPLLILSSSKLFTIPLGLASLLTPYGNNYQVLFAGSVLAIIPIFIVFLKFQKYFIEGLTAGGVKG